MSEASYYNLFVVLFTGAYGQPGLGIRVGGVSGDINVMSVYKNSDYYWTVAASLQYVSSTSYKLTQAGAKYENWNNATVNAVEVGIKRIYGVV